MKTFGRSKAPWTNLHAQIHRTLRQRSLLTKNQRVLVGVSGGQDSLCLIRLLLDLQPKWQWHLAIAHCNHRWRSDSTANAEYVKELAAVWQVPFYCQTVNDEQIASVQNEAGARDWRYKALITIAQQNNYSHLATGHTASDRAETLLYNLMRGSGADGLQALTWQRQLTPSLQLVRPLLEVTRAQTTLFCQDFQLQPWLDTTNEDVKYARNRIRKELFPYLQTHFNPQIEQALAQTAELLTAEVTFLEQQTEQVYRQAIWQETEGRRQEAEGGHQELEFSNSSSPLPYSTSPMPPCPTSPRKGLNRQSLRSAPLALQRRVMRRFLQQVMQCAPEFEHIEKLISLIEAPNRSQTDPFPGGALARVQGDWIWIIDSNAIN